jgi:hypothetical protein
VEAVLPARRSAHFVFALELTGDRGTAQLTLTCGGRLAPRGGGIKLDGELELAEVLSLAGIDVARCLASLRGQLSARLLAAPPAAAGCSPPSRACGRC